MNTNAIYGVLGNNSSLFYNIYVASSITCEGRALISSATMFFEMFLSNNVKFASLNEIITFIDNVTSERESRIYNDNNVLDRNVDAADVFAKLVMTTGDFRQGKVKWIPDEKDLQIIWDIITQLGQEDLNRIYYKNNLYVFMENTSMVKSLIYILKKMETPYLDPNDVPNEVKIELETLQNILKEYVYYGYQIIDRVDRCDNMIKNVSIISDTDSAIVSLDAWYRFVLDKVKDIPMEINKVYSRPIEYFEADESGEYHNWVRPVEYEEAKLDFDFYNDEIIEMERLIHPVEIIPQDNLRFSIINIMAYIVSNLANDYMELFTKQAFSYEEGRKCLLFLKNEFLFKRALLTDAKKNYATIPQLQEGKLVNGGKGVLDIKGLPINKSTLNEKAKAQLQKILFEDILNMDSIDQITVIKKLAIMEKQIYQSLESGNSEYYKPAAIKSLSNYDDPMRIQGIKGAVIWNGIKDDNLEAIDLTARNTVNIVKVNITEGNRDKIKDKYPSTYEKLVNLMEDRSIFKSTTKDNAKTVFDNNITAISLPTDVKTPEWLKEFIDYNLIINDCMKNFPVESIGIARLGVSNVNYTNIMKI